MSESHFAGRIYFLEGPDGREELAAAYDEVADVLYLWVGAEPVEAVSFPTDDGPVVRVDPDTGKVVGVTLMDFGVFWASKHKIELDVPPVGPSERATARADAREHRQLVLA